MARWNPVDELTNLHREMDRLFARPWSDPSGNETTSAWLTGHSGFMPAAEMASDENAWHVRIALPGIDPKDVQVEVTGTTLSVSGERRDGTTAARRHGSEISCGRFERRFTIPERIDVDKVQASFTHGMLELTLPLEEAAKPRRIAIKGNGLFKKS